MALSEEKYAVQKRRHRMKYPEKERARNLATKAIRSGRIKLKRCSVVGCKRTDIQAHHVDYAKPLEVVSICRYHHTKFHKNWVQK